MDDRLLLDAFEQRLVPGDVSRAAALEPDVLALRRSARAAGLLGYLAVLRGDGVSGAQYMRPAWDAHDPATEPLVGAAAAANMIMLSLIACHASDGLMWADRTFTSAQGISPDLAAIGVVMGAVALIQLGRGSEVERRLAVLPASATEIPEDALVMRGVAYMWSGKLRSALADLALAAARERSGVPLRFQSQSLAHCGEAEFRLGAWDDAVMHTELAVSLSHAADRELDYAFVHGYAAFVPANRGEWEVAEHHVAICRAVAEQTGLPAQAAVAAVAGGMFAAAREDPAGVLQAMALVRAAGQTEASGRPGAYDWRPYEIDALIATGRIDDAERALGEFEALIPDGLQTASVALSRLQGTLACVRGDHAEAAARFAAAWAAADGLEAPFELAAGPGRRLSAAPGR